MEGDAHLQVRSLSVCFHKNCSSVNIFMFFIQFFIIEGSYTFISIFIIRIFISVGPVFPELGQFFAPFSFFVLLVSKSFSPVC